MSFYPNGRDRQCTSDHTGERGLGLWCEPEGNVGGMPWGVIEGVALLDRDLPSEKSLRRDDICSET